jgi:hypothetical protein
MELNDTKWVLLFQTALRDLSRDATNILLSVEIELNILLHCNMKISENPSLRRQHGRRLQ